MTLATDNERARPHHLAVGAAGIILNRALLRAGLRRRVDGWRRAAGLMLRGEESTFVLSAFGLDVWSDGPRTGVPDLAESEAHAAERLRRFFRGETGCHVRVRRSKSEDRAERCDGPSYSLCFEPWREGTRRFQCPEAWGSAEVMGDADECSPLMQVVCRGSPDGQCDVWLRVNHVGSDGVPIQEVLSRLEQSWGMRQPVHFPTPEEFAPLAVPRPWPGRAGLAQVQDFVDFGPLLAWRKRENSRLAEPMTVGAAIQWKLAAQPSFESLHFGSTVEVAPIKGLGSGVGVVVVRPSDYRGRADGLARFARDFNRQVEANRVRASAGCRTLDAAAFLPAPVASSLLRHALERQPAAFGSIALTMLKSAKVFGAPIAKFGHERGFVAIGSLSLPTSDGRSVGCITVKGPTAVIAEYPARFRAAMESQ